MSKRPRIKYLTSYNTSASMNAFDALPRELRDYLNYASVGWYPESVFNLWKNNFQRNTAATLQKLQMEEQNYLQNLK